MRDLSFPLTIATHAALNVSRIQRPQKIQSIGKPPPPKRQDHGTSLRRSMMPHANLSARVIFPHTLFRITLILFLLFGVSHKVSAQESTATIVGLVTEASGGVIPNATVHIKNVATNTVRTVTTGGSGDFNVPFLTAGRYTITVEASGFQTRTLEGITLEVGQTARVDSQLKVGTVSEIVQVDSVAVATQTEDAVVGTVIDAHKIVDLPLNGRNFVQLAQLIPGANTGTPA